MVAAHCPHCGHTFISNAISGHNARISIRDILVPCPQCGQNAKVLDADYNYDFLGNAKMSSASPETIGIIAALQATLQIARQVEKSGDSEDKIIDNIEKFSPGLAVEARTAIKTGGIGRLILLLFLLLNTCSQNTKGAIDWNELIDQAHVYVTGADPYPTAQSHTEAQENNDSSPQMSRQQRRQQERQSRKPRKQGGRPPEPKKSR